MLYFINTYYVTSYISLICHIPTVSLQELAACRLDTPPLSYACCELLTLNHCVLLFPFIPLLWQAQHPTLSFLGTRLYKTRAVIRVWSSRDDTGGGLMTRLPRHQILYSVLVSSTIIDGQNKFVGLTTKATTTLSMHC